MLSAFCPRTIWAISVGFFRNCPESSPGKIYKIRPSKRLGLYIFQTRGVLQKRLAPEAYRARGGIARNSIANRVIVGRYRVF